MEHGANAVFDAYKVKTTQRIRMITLSAERFPYEICALECRVAGTWDEFVDGGLWWWRSNGVTRRHRRVAVQHHSACSTGRTAASRPRRKRIRHRRTRGRQRHTRPSVIRPRKASRPIRSTVVVRR